MNQPATLVLVPARANEETVAAFERLLTQAKAGEIGEIVVVAFEPNGDHEITASSTMSVTRRVGALTIAIHSLCAHQSVDTIVG